MKDMFYYSGMINNWDGRCENCPNWILEYSGTGRCAETNDNITSYVLNGRINKNCPFIQKDEA